MSGAVCARCGKEHAGPPTPAFKFPIEYLDVPEHERERRVFLTDDLCVIDDARFFVRGCLEVPVHGACDPFIWGVWVAVSEEDFHLFQDLLGVAERSQHGPFEGRLASPPRPYPDGTELAVLVRLRDRGVRPFVEVAASPHPLAREQRDGISPERVTQILELMRPPSR